MMFIHRYSNFACMVQRTVYEVKGLQCQMKKQRNHKTLKGKKRLLQCESTTKPSRERKYQNSSPIESDVRQEQQQQQQRRIASIR